MKAIHANSRLSLYENEIRGKGDTYRTKIYNLLADKDIPMTDRQIINALHVTDVNNIRPEITRLKQAGLLIEAGKAKCCETGKTVRMVRVNKKFCELLF